jgi:hypothetical protein
MINIDLFPLSSTTFRQQKVNHNWCADWIANHTKKNLKEDKKLLIDNFPATKTHTVSMENWCADWIANQAS